DELLINKQRCDNIYRDILSRIRGLVTVKENPFQNKKLRRRLNELYIYMNQLPLVDTICLLSTCYLCKVLNIAMLDKIDGDEILLITEVDIKVDIKFEVFHKLLVHRKQFPLSLSYGIAVHKSQGITGKNAIMDLRTSVFSDGQAYVGLS
ncbi:PIF1 helicase, partial [Acromyrmex heyeri]